MGQTLPLLPKTVAVAAEMQFETDTYRLLKEARNMGWEGEAAELERLR